MEQKEFKLFEESVKKNLSNKYNYVFFENGYLNIFLGHKIIFSFYYLTHSFEVWFANPRNNKNPTRVVFNIDWLIHMELLPTQIIMIDNWMAIKLLE